MSFHARVIDRARTLETAKDAVIATDADGVVIYWGRGAERLYGWTGHEALGRNVVDLTPTELSRADAEQIMRTLSSGKSWSGEFLVRAKDGSRFMVQVTDMPVRDRAGRLIGIIGSSQRTSYLPR
jgi:PAS domain S-box-containing protein